MQGEANAEPSKFGKLVLRVGLAGLIPLLTAAAYMAGLSYSQAYLFVFGIPSKLITKSTADYFVHAYMAMSETLLRLIGVTGLAIVGMAVFVIYMWWAVNWLERRVESSQGIQKVREQVRSRPFLRRIRDAIMVPIFAVAVGYLAFASFIVFVLPEGLGQYAGRARALKDLAVFKRGCAQTQKEGPMCNEVYDGEKRIAYGFVIDSSEAYVAVYENGLVRTFPGSGKYFISRPTPKVAH